MLSAPHNTPILDMIHGLTVFVFTCAWNGSGTYLDVDSSAATSAGLMLTVGVNGAIEINV